MPGIVNSGIAKVDGMLTDHIASFQPVQELNEELLSDSSLSPRPTKAIQLTHTLHDIVVLENV